MNTTGDKKNNSHCREYILRLMANGWFAPGPYSSGAQLLLRFNSQWLSLMAVHPLLDVFFDKAHQMLFAPEIRC